MYARTELPRGGALLRGEPPRVLTVLVRTTGRMLVDDDTGHVLAVEVALPECVLDMPELAGFRRPFVSVGLLSTV